MPHLDISAPRERGLGTAHARCAHVLPRPGGRQRAQSTSCLFGAKGASVGEESRSGKGFHTGAMRPRPTGWQDEGHRGAHDGVTSRAFSRRRPPFVRIACTSCPLQIGRCGIPSRSIFGKRTGASINRTSHHHDGEGSSDHPHTHKLTELKNTSPPEAVHPLYLFVLSLQGNPPHHTGVGYYTTSVARTSITPVSLVPWVRRARP